MAKYKQLGTTNKIHSKKSRRKGGPGRGKKFMEKTEVLITSELTGQLFHASIWDADTTVSLASFKGGTSHPRTLCTIGQQYLISAVNNRSHISSWPLSTRDTNLIRLVTPGVVTAMAVSPCNNYVALSVAETIHVWKIHDSTLVAVPTCHYQTVRCLAFTDDSSHVVSGGDDNQIVIWPLVRILMDRATSTTAMSEPRHVLSDHSLPITDLRVGRGGINSRIISASLDHTCKLWQLHSGELLMSIIFNTGMTACLLDNTETRLFAAGFNSHIYQINLYDTPIRTERHVTDKDDAIVFKGHSKQVTCLQISLDGSRLFSGSHDHSVRIWDIVSKQCTKILTHRGPISNVLVMSTPRMIINPDLLPSMHLPKIHRHTTDGENKQRHTTVLKKVTEKLSTNEVFTSAKRFKSQSGKSVQHTLQEIQSVTSLNNDLYNFAVKKLLRKKSAGKRKSMDTS